MKYYTRVKQAEKDKIIKLYNNGWGVKRIARRLKRSHKTISRAIKRAGLKVKSSVEVSRKHFLNENYFQIIDSFEKAYWLGWLWSDGNIKNGTITINLSRKDRYILKRFNTALESTYKIKNYVSILEDKKYKLSQLRIYSCKLINQLKNIGFVENKGKSANIPKIPLEFMPGFILGEFEGDGSVSICKNCCSGRINIFDTYDICMFIKNYIDQTFGRDIGSIRKCNSNVYDYTVSVGKDLLDIYELLYNKAKMFLNRKRNKFHKLFIKLKNRKNHSTSKFRGVSFHKSYGKFASAFQYKGQRWISFHDDEIEAAKHYDVRAKAILGKKAVTNF